MESPRVDLRMETFRGRVGVLAVFEDEDYWRSNERQVYTNDGMMASLDRVWYRKHTRPATYQESKEIIATLCNMYGDIRFCTIDWQAHSKRKRNANRRKND